MKNLYLTLITACLILFSALKIIGQTYTLNPYMPGTTCSTCIVTSNTTPKGGGGNNSVMNGNGTIGTSYVASACGLNYVMSKVKLGKRLPSPGVNQPAGISVAGLPPCFVVLKAFLYTGGSGNGMAFSATVQNPVATSSVFPMTMIGTHVDKCWSYSGTYNYRADITALITGNGNYNVSGIPTNPPVAGNDMDGASIVIIYQDLTQTYTGHIVIGDGCQVGIGGQVNNTLNGFNACAASTFANAFMIVSDLQNVAVANCFMNSAVTNFAYATASQSWWDNIVLATAPAVTAGQATTAFGLSSGGDCFNIVAEGLYYRTNCNVCTPGSTLTVTAASTPSCPTSNATVTATGGTAPYSYTWTPSAQSTSVATGLAAGVYTVFVKDATGCKTGSTTVTVVTANLNPITISSGTICPTFSANLSASGASTYTWSPPTGLNTITGANVVASPAATQIYSVSFTNTLGCVGTQTTQVIVNPTPTLTTSNVTVCAGSAINLTANSLAGSTYSWSGPNGFTSNVQNPVIAISTTLMTGPYTVTVTSSVGCKNTAIANVTVFAMPVPIIGSNAPICANNNLILTGSGGTTYSWVGPNGFTSLLQNPTITGATTLATGVYTLTASSNGCSASTSSLLTINPLPTPTLTSNSPVCNGLALNLSGSGGNTYSWAGPSAFTSTLQNPVISPASPSNSGIYTLTAISVNGCTATVTSSITINPTPTISITGATVCLNTTINLASSSLAGSTYSWSGPNGFTSNVQNPSITNATLLMSGVYNLTVTSSVGCKNTATTNVTVLSLPTPTITSNSPVCFGSVLTLTAGGGLTYQWNGPNGFSSTSTNPSISNITLAGSGNYSLIASVGTCSAIIVQSITVNPLPVPTATNNGPLCNGQTLNLTSGGATTYTWSGPSTYSSTIQNPSIALAAPANSGIYTVTVTDLNGCKNFTTTSVTINPTPTLSATGTTVCLNTTINLFGNALAGSTYSWSGPLGFASNVQNPTITNATLLMSGVYNLTVTSTFGCTNTTTTNVSVLSLPTPTITSNSPVCIGSILTLTAGGGVTYQWNGPNGFSSTLTNPTISNITLAGSGTYSLIAIVGTCTASITKSITVNPLPLPTASNNGPICNGAALNLSSAGATTYTWSGPSTYTSINQNPSISPASPANSGVYTVTVTDLNGCKNFTTTTVTVNPTPTLSATGSTVCLNTTISLFGNALAGSTYSWSGPLGFGSTLQNPTITNATALMSGVYTLTVTSSFGCTNTTTTNVSVLSLPVPVITSNAPVCFGSILTLTAGGGVTYQWNGPNGFSSTLSNPTISNIALAGSGNYSLIAIVGTCTASTSQSLTVNPLPLPTASNNGPICNGAALNLSSAGAATYTWSGPSTFASTNQNPSIPVVSIANAGTYTVTVTDANGCKNFTTTSVLVNPTPTLSTTGSSVCVGQTMSVGANSLPGATYAWSGPNGFTAIGQNTTVTNAQTIMSGVYNVTVTSSVGCKNTGVTNVSITPLPVPVLINNSPICIGAALNFTATGGSSYIWSGPNGFNNVTANPSINNVSLGANGMYSVIVTANSCSIIATTNVTINPLPTPIASNNAPICEKGVLNLSGSGGSTYSWTGPLGFTSSTQNPSISNVFSNNSGVYNLTVIDANGCQASTSTTVFINPIPNLLANGATVCFGFSASLTATGGLTYSWVGPNGFTSNSQNPTIPVVDNNTIGNYTVTITSVNTCTSSSAVNVGTYPLPAPTITATAKTCINTPVSLQGSTGFLMYQWTGPNNFLSPNSATSFTPTSMSQSGMYTLSVTDNRGCVGSVSTWVTLDPLPNANIILDKNKNCIPFCSNFSLLNAPGAASLVTAGWVFNGQTFSGTTLNYCVTNAGDYLIKANFTDANGCPNSASYTLNAYPIPTAMFEYSPGKPLEVIDEVKFTDESKGPGINSWYWHFTSNTGYQSTSQHPSYTYEKAGTYPIALVVTNKWGCSDTIVKTITIGEGNSFYVPNAFTPNGDGINDTFFAKGYNITKFEMTIFDRWGEKLFNTNDFTGQWDGTFKGEDCKNDVYVWKISVTTPDSKVKTYTGHVTINR